jgi:hypothetical protein
MSNQRRVFVVNKSSHDFGPAEQYGQVQFLSSGSMNRYATNSMVRLFEDSMKESEAEDYIVPCSLNVMNAIACAIFAHKHGRLNLLLYKDGVYIERNHIL